MTPNQVIGEKLARAKQRLEVAPEEDRSPSPVHAAKADKAASKTTHVGGVVIEVRLERTRLG